VLVEMLQVWSV